jgi:hypothetical protein
MIIIYITLFVFIICLLWNNKIETFKNHQTFEPKYLNNPKNMLHYQNKIEYAQKDLNVSTFGSTKRIQSNKILSTFSEKDDKVQINPLRKTKSLTTKYKTPKLETDIFNNINYIVPLSSENDIDKYITENENKCMSNKQKLPKRGKYTLYADNLFTFEPAKKLLTNDTPNIDQTISSNIKNYVEHGVESFDNNQITNENNCTININHMNGKTIKEIYDDITNDGRMQFQQNLDDLEANDNRNDFIIGEKYGATRFDTYSVNPSTY